MEIITGGVTAAEGFEAASTAAGIKYQDRTDMALVYSKAPCVAAGTFTTNVVKAAPVQWDRQVIDGKGKVQALDIARKPHGRQEKRWGSLRNPLLSVQQE